MAHLAKDAANLSVLCDDLSAMLSEARWDQAHESCLSILRQVSTIESRLRAVIEVMREGYAAAAVDRALDKK